MSGIDRVLAGILLVGAVGGTAAFARHSGSDPSAPAVSLTAPPLQHVDAPGTVLFAHTPAPLRVAVDVRRHSRPRLAATAPPRTAAAPAPKPAPNPISPPEPRRVLAAVVTAVQPATETKADGRALGHAKQQGGAAAPGQGHGRGHTTLRATAVGD